MRRSKGCLGRIDLNEKTADLPLETFWCRIDNDTQDSHNYNEQMHSFFELHIALCEECEFQLGEEHATLRHGEYLLLPPHTNHKLTVASKNFTKLVWGFAIHDVKIHSALAEACERVQTRPLREIAQKSLELLISESENTDDFQSFFLIKSNLFAILIHIIREMTKLHSDQRIYKKNRAIMAEMCRFVRENLKARIGLREASKWLYISERHLERLCLAEYNKSFSEIKRGIQFETIHKLLTTTDMPLSKISAEAGFSDEYTMNKFFKRTCGSTPAKYRKLHKDENVGN